MFTKYGYSTIGIVFIVIFVLIVISILVNYNFVRILLLLLSVCLIVFTLNFFRDPERTIPNKENIVVSPADGRVLFVKDILDDKFLNSKAKLVSIFMSPLNVHVNRIPITGKVEHV
jgi:phosphatidylserine decarboxylase